jgi:hypothetical protein
MSVFKSGRSALEGLDDAASASRSKVASWKPPNRLVWQQWFEKKPIIHFIEVNRRTVLIQGSAPFSRGAAFFVSWHWISRRTPLSGSGDAFA